MVTSFKTAQRRICRFFLDVVAGLSSILLLIAGPVGVLYSQLEQTKLERIIVSDFRFRGEEN